MNTEKELGIDELMSNMIALVMTLRQKKRENKDEISEIESEIERLNEIIISKINNE